ncbi:MAG TPA: peptidase S14 [Alphaproteobacteria bacterium]|nr:peptidase S14 [Alphaproteobacteria bacterium]
MKFKDILARAMRPADGKPVALDVRDLDEGEAEILLYDQIGFWGITAEEFRRQLSAIEADTIHLRIDSPGGDVFMARAMKTALEQHSAKIVAHIDGLAASAASYIMLGADEIEMAQGAFLMIHNAWMITLGDAVDHSDSAAMLTKIDGSIRADYAAKSGKSAEYFAPLMDAETWFDADEALAEGLIDRIYQKDGGAENRFDLSIFDNAPEALTAPDPAEEVAEAHRARQMRKLDIIDRLAS